MSHYASIKGSNRPCNGVRIERKRTINKKSGSKLNHQFVVVRTEEFEFMPERVFRTLAGGIEHIEPPVMRVRPVIRHITHNCPR